MFYVINTTNNSQNKEQKYYEKQFVYKFPSTLFCISLTT